MTIEKQLENLKTLEDEKGKLQDKIDKIRQTLNQTLIDENVKTFKCDVATITSQERKIVKYQNKDQVIEYLKVNHLENFIDFIPAKEEISKDYEKMLKEERITKPSGVEIITQNIPVIKFN